MKKLVIFGMLIFGIMAMAEKLNTDGKDHLKELLGKWGEPYNISIVVKNNKIFYIDDEGVSPVQKIRNDIYQIIYEDNASGEIYKTCFAYDIKYKKLAFLKNCTTLELQELVPRKFTDGKLRG